jgi:ketosteroid isomerase-like protein
LPVTNRTRFIARSGETIVGRDRVAEILSGMIRAKTRLESDVVKAITIGDIAQLYTDFDGTTLDASGKIVNVHYKAIEILRRQPEGDWKLIIGDPNGRRDLIERISWRPLALAHLGF